MTKKILSAIFILVISGCLLPSFAKKDEQAVITPQTQLQKRQYQTKQYSNVKKDVLMKAMLNVLQDEGFIVNNANPTLGFISGAKAAYDSSPFSYVEKGEPIVIKTGDTIYFNFHIINPNDLSFKDIFIYSIEDSEVNE